MIAKLKAFLYSIIGRLNPRIRIKTEKKLLAYMANVAIVQLRKNGVKQIDSNCLHFMLYNVIRDEPELKKHVTCGWYYHGPYFPLLDDVLVEAFGMDKKYHQLKGEDPYRYEWSETEYEVKK